ncbi:MAG TPA: ROK family protein, partial [Candidatus Goldiibacteriota bacterium]|nr:ROK family protein [Candidatus Goldiibacteriota bacterium]
NIKVGVVTATGQVVSSLSVPTEGQGGPDHVVGRMTAAALQAIQAAKLPKERVLGVGIGAPGSMSHKQGLIISPPNLPGWKNIKLKAILEKKTGIKTGVENDANCAVYAEKWMGAAKSFDNVVGFTLGTGVGGGIIIDGKLIRGASNTAGELGHTIIEMNGRQCGCGNKGCLEAYASASAIANTAKEKIKAGSKSMITEMVKGDLNKITSKTVYEALLNNDKTASEVWQYFAESLASGIAAALNSLNPQAVVIAGGVINAGDRLFVPLKKETAKRSFTAPFNAAKILPAKLGEFAGAIGAAGVVLNEGDYYGIK